MAQNVTAFELDDTVAATEDGVTLAGIPGIWRLGETYLPDALGLTLKEMREAVATLGLPLREVKVGSGQAYDTFAPDDSNRFSSTAVIAGAGGQPVEEEIAADEPVQGDAVQVDHALDVAAAAEQTGEEDSL